MQLDVTPALIVSAAGVGLAFQAAVIGVAVMIRGTAKDLAKESAARVETEKAVDARFVELAKESTTHTVAIRTLETRANGVDALLQRQGDSIEGQRRALTSLLATAVARRTRRS